MTKARSSHARGLAIVRAAARAALVPAAALLLGAAGCRAPAAPTPYARYRVLDVAGDTFRVEISDPTVAAEADSLAHSRQERFVTGRPEGGANGYNAPWSWHIAPSTVGFAEVTAEACQTTARGVEDNLDYWLRYGQACIPGTVEARER